MKSEKVFSVLIFCALDYTLCSQLQCFLNMHSISPMSGDFHTARRKGKIFLNMEIVLIKHKHGGGDSRADLVNRIPFSDDHLGL